MTDLPVEQTWMVLVNLLTDLRKRGIEIDPEIQRTSGWPRPP